jgi:hypothetical protein
MRVVLREGVSESLSGGSFLGFIKVLMLVWVRLWGGICAAHGHGDDFSNRSGPVQAEGVCEWGVFLHDKDMRPTQGQAAFGHNVQTIITFLNEVKTFSNMYRWARIFHARLLHPLLSSAAHKQFRLKYSNFRNIPASPSRGAKQHRPVELGSFHEANCAGVVDTRQLILHSY